MIAQIPSSYANAIAPFSPLGKTPVGQESVELKSSSFKSLEQAADSGRTLNYRDPDQRPNDEIEQDRQTRAYNENRDSQQGAGESEQQKQEREKLEQQLISELAARDREVRMHEMAHAAVGGQYAGSPSYQYERGPDGASYAVSGEVSISTSAIAGDPEATLRKAEQIQRAAHAPTDPSAQDRQVAAVAAQMAVEARAELLVKDQESQNFVTHNDKDGSIAQADGLSKDEQMTKERDERDKDTAEKDALAPDQLHEKQRQQFNELTRRFMDIGVYGANSRRGTVINQQI